MIPKVAYRKFIQFNLFEKVRFFYENPQNMRAAIGIKCYLFASEQKATF